MCLHVLPWPKVGATEGSYVPTLNQVAGVKLNIPIDKKDAETWRNVPAEKVRG